MPSLPSLRPTSAERSDHGDDAAESTENSTETPTRARTPTPTRARTPTATRRRLLTAGAAAASVGLAGCAETIGNLIAEFVLDDVNLLNETDRVLTGSIAVTDPDGETVLDESFDLEPAADEEDETTEASQAVYSDLFERAGEYGFTVELADDEIDGETGAELVREISDAEEEHAVIVMGSDDLSAGFGLFVIEEFTDLGGHIDEAATDDD